MFDNYYVNGKRVKFSKFVDILLNGGNKKKRKKTVSKKQQGKSSWEILEQLKKMRPPTFNDYLKENIILKK